MFNRNIIRLILCALLLGISHANAQNIIFSENFSSGNFTTNGWTFSPSQGNWSVGSSFTPNNATVSNAYFSGTPTVSNYSYSLVSDTIDATAFSNLKLDFKLLLSDSIPNTLEHFGVEIKKVWSSNWIPVYYINTSYGNVYYSTNNVALSYVDTSKFQIRFTASGISSSSILGWGLDDILIRGITTTPCSGQPIAGIASGTNICAPSINLLGGTAAVNINVQWQSRQCGGSWTNITGATDYLYTANYQSGPTDYRAIINCTNSGLFDTSNIIFINTITPCYCYSAASYHAGNDITNVTIDTFSNSSPCAHNVYTPFTNIPPAIMVKGVSIPFSVTITDCDTFTYPSGTVIFIDLNKDGIFSVNERVAYTTTSIIGSGVFSGSFTIGANASTGITGMRVINEYNVFGASIGGCDNVYPYGETEDYLVNIKYAPSVTGGGIYCSGQDVTLTASSSGNINPTYLWKYPNNTYVITPFIYFPNIQPNQAGTYTLYLLTPGCLGNPPDTSAPAFANIIVNPFGNITGDSTVCVGDSITLTESLSGGTWSVTNTNAFVSSTGIVTGNTAGMDTVFYTVIYSCGIDTSWHEVNVIPTSICNLNVASTSNSNSISVYPNPNTGSFKIKGVIGNSGDKEIRIEVINILGRVVYKKQITIENNELNETISLNRNINSGLYILRISSATENKTFHIVVQR